MSNSPYHDDSDPRQNRNSSVQSLFARLDNRVNVLKLIVKSMNGYKPIIHLYSQPMDTDS